MSKIDSPTSREDEKELMETEGESGDKSLKNSEEPSIIVDEVKCEEKNQQQNLPKDEIDKIDQIGTKLGNKESKSLIEVSKKVIEHEPNKLDPSQTETKSEHVGFSDFKNRFSRAFIPKKYVDYFKKNEEIAKSLNEKERKEFKKKQRNIYIRTGAYAILSFCMGFFSRMCDFALVLFAKTWQFDKEDLLSVIYICYSLGQVTSIFVLIPLYRYFQTRQKWWINYHTFLSLAFFLAMCCSIVAPFCIWYLLYAVFFVYGIAALVIYNTIGVGSMWNWPVKMKIGLKINNASKTFGKCVETALLSVIFLFVEAEHHQLIIAYEIIAFIFLLCGIATLLIPFPIYPVDKNYSTKQDQVMNIQKDKKEEENSKDDKKKKEKRSKCCLKCIKGMCQTRYFITILVVLYVFFTLTSETTFRRTFVIYTTKPRYFSLRGMVNETSNSTYVIQEKLPIFKPSVVTIIFTIGSLLTCISYILGLWIVSFLKPFLMCFISATGMIISLGLIWVDAFFPIGAWVIMISFTLCVFISFSFSGFVTYLEKSLGIRVTVIMNILIITFLSLKEAISTIVIAFSENVDEGFLIIIPFALAVIAWQMLVLSYCIGKPLYKKHKLQTIRKDERSRILVMFW